jgi:branched-chain amino acid transport system substrate-binding protein
MVEQLPHRPPEPGRGRPRQDTKAANFRALAGKIKASGAHCFYFGGVTANKAAQLFGDVHAANPAMELFGPDGIAEDAFTEAIGPSVECRLHLTILTLPAKSYPPAGQKVFRSFNQKYGKQPDAYALYGYEAMAVTLDAIRRAGDSANDRAAVVEAFFKTRDRESVLGRYSIDRNGDTTLTDYGGYRVENDRLVFEKVLKTQDAS